VSQAALFGFGSVIFFIVATGAFLYGMATLDQFYNKDYDKELE
jgi:Ni,Fe-hydrogenase I cytochrome b subunit